MSQSKIHSLTLLLLVAFLNRASFQFATSQTEHLQTGFNASALVEERVQYFYDETEFEGYFVYDKTCEGMLTLVLVNMDWDGVTEYEEWRAKRFADDCYAAFAVDVYGIEVGAGDALPFSTRSQLVGGLYGNQARTHGILQAALDAIKEHEIVHSSDYLAVGFCLGGFTSMEFVRMGAPMLGAVAFHVGNPAVAGPVNFTNAAEGARVVIFNGADDTSVREGAYDAWVAEATEAGLTWEYTLYGNTVHAFTNPALAPEFLEDPSSSNNVYNPYSEERAIQQTLELFKDFKNASRSDYLVDPWTETGVDLSVLEQIEVNYTDPYDGASLQGIAVYDSSFCGERPAVLIVSDWDGISDYEIWRARLLAHLGYFAFIVDVHSTEIEQPIEDQQVRIQQTGFYLGTPQRIRARLLAGLKEVQSERHANLVMENMAVIIGYCFGGTSILEFVRDDPQGLTGAVSFHGGDLETSSSKIQKGNDVKVLVLNGGDDTSVTPEEIEGFFEEFMEADVQFEFTNFAYTPHGWTNPAGRHVGLSDWRSWTSFLGFLDNVFEGTKAAEC